MPHTFTLLATALLVMVTTFASAQTHTLESSLTFESSLTAATTDWIETRITSQTVGRPTDLVYRP
ncbi:hypothetical protein [Pontivivens nitratireducens]|uniref:Uncharacterized protein n=1 Tax=Pontivivens nitratireducens TaxID=2758038 RepID=A0A6G7VQU0_9RHOB|nr:hypothetical protein [Pontibrevibacter nitratireducens]QIK42245.1 hypothetical protein G8E03_15425 [Pontibrevibacter nitratireducens]